MEIEQVPKDSREGFRYNRRYTKPETHPYESFKWENRDAVITDSKGQVIFEQKNVEVPTFWSQTATNIVASKYFRGRLGTPERESSVRQLIDRVAKTITVWGRKGNYFLDEQESNAFEAELTHILVHQMAAFNSPVWFNVGVEAKPQCSACFINSVQDDMRSIMQLATTEGMLFKYGSGTGSNLSKLRSSQEHLSTGGKASGPVSFMKGFDAFAGVIKSGGRTRRAAKMVILNVDHPDILEFIWSKAKEEKKAWALIDAGYDPAVDGEAYGSVYFQNANHSVRVTDDFMHAVTDDKEWKTHFITTGKVAQTYKARELMKAMGEAAHICGDPGIQFDSTINEWNPCSNTGRINASNPCSEYMFLDDSACNLASLNLMKFRTQNGDFDIESFMHAVEIVITAQEILVDNASYPTPSIEKNSHDYRPLGMGYANLGALLMARGLPYDSEEGRNFAAAISALMSGHTYSISSVIAKRLGSFRGYPSNEKPFLNVIGMHRAHSNKIPHEGVPRPLLDAAAKSWDVAHSMGERYGFRNAQISVIAPTGTIAFMMDCDTTGIEPDIALVKYKWLVGGGMIKIVNNTIPEGLKHLGYSQSETQDILQYLEANDTIEGAPHLKGEHLPVFDCAFKPAKGSRSIHYMGHVKMMAAVQPFISGAISKTVNMPNNVTVDEIVQTYTTAWKTGLKAIAIYRDGSKRTQPLTTARQKEEPAPVEKVVYKPARRRLPDEREAVIHKFTINGNEGYLTVGLYKDGSPGEMFVVMSKEGSTISGLMDAFATSISLALQYGVPLRVLVNKFIHTRFEPAGMTNNPEIRFAKSVIDYIFRWMGLRFLSKADQDAIGLTRTQAENPDAQAKLGESHPQTVQQASSVQHQTAPVRTEVASGTEDRDLLTFDLQSDAPACDNCGMIMVRNGSCYKCLNCGNTSGCG
ncbi:MAG TPA: vitamin B12-dependent ribonucleotide reductase [Candidatus Bathyarchaeia archaeon]|nr:vitamin B12-dependent ribonucleotide reductase [Candidatus Bathyarchaeia archaeon]